jgi:hypothetical protein
MNDITFNCPHCGQHIACDAEAAGRETTCPTCVGQITVPLAAGRERGLRFPWGVACLAVAVASVVGLVCFFLPDIREMWAWRTAKTADTVESYANYLKSWRACRHAEEARRRQDERAWAHAQKQSTEEGFNAYLQALPAGSYAAEARNRVEEILWHQTTNFPTVESVTNYLGAYPRGRFRSAAAVMLKDMEGGDIFELMRERKIKVSARGDGIQSVDFEVGRLVSHAVTLRVAAGTLCLSGTPSAQNMVLTKTREHTVTGESISFSVSAACVNLHKEIPKGETEFRLERGRPDGDLAKLVSLLATREVDYATRQAAIWIVTDNATTEELHRLALVGSGIHNFGSRNQLINEPEIASAIQLCSEAGIDVTRKAIWIERDPLRIQRDLNRTLEMLRQRYGR